MAADDRRQEPQTRAALEELSELADRENGVPLEALLLGRDSKSALRVQRLVGIALKRKLALPKPHVAHSATGTGQSGLWPDRTDALVQPEGNEDFERVL